MSSDNTEVDGLRPLLPPRETLLTLFEMLLQHAGSSELQPNQPSFEDARFTVDEHHQTIGAEAFNRFHKRIDNLDKQLRNLAGAARQLESSVAILSSAFRLREKIAPILILYRQNAADLFPRKIAHAKESLDMEIFPAQFESLAKHLVTFGRCLNEFPEFNDESIDTSINSFQNDLRYWASCLDDYRGQFRYPAVQRYVHDLAVEMGEHLDSITSALTVFLEIGVPAIRLQQKHKTDDLVLNLSAVATFFSAVTATTLQFSFDLRGSVVKDAVNSFWFMSLVFSSASAVNSLLGITWKQSIYRSPGHRVPWWVGVWVKRTPHIFLVISVICFSVGLCLFAFASNQSTVTFTLTTIFTIFTSLGLASVLAWSAMERYVFMRHRGQKWLLDVLSDAQDNFIARPGVERTRKIWRSIKHFRGLRKALVPLNSGSEKSDDLETNMLPISSEHTRDPSTETSNVHLLRTSTEAVTSPVSPPLPADSASAATPTQAQGASGVDDGTESGPSTPTPITPGVPSKGKLLWKNALQTVKMRSIAAAPAATSPVSPPLFATDSASAATPTQAQVISGVGTGTEYGPSTPTPTTPGAPSKGKLLWKNALQTVKMRSVAAAPLGPRMPRSQRTLSPMPTTEVERESPMDERTRIITLKPKLNALMATETLEAHQALVRHMQFSPDGKFLATSSWDRTTIIWRVDKRSLSLHRVLAHPQGFVGQVAWSDTGNMLLTKLVRGVKVWTEDGVCQKTIDRQTNVESITWFPGSQAFLSVEDNIVTKLDLRGKVLDQYNFGRMKLYDVAVTPDGTRLLVVGPLVKSSTGLQPSRSSVEKRLVVYNTETKQVEHQTPVLNDVRDITLTRNTRDGVVALVSYENKAPPQLWKMDLLKDRENAALRVARLTLRHTYMPQNMVEFAGPSYFGGKNDELVLCAGKAGDIHIWDQESGTLLRHIRAQAQQSGDMTCIAWNHSADPFMFTTGSHDGAVRIWTTPDREPPAQSEGDTSQEDGEGDAEEAQPTVEKPCEMDDFERTDSPLTQAEFDAVDALRLRESTSASEVSLGTSTFQGERMVAFAAGSDEE